MLVIDKFQALRAPQQWKLRVGSKQRSIIGQARHTYDKLDCPNNDSKILEGRLTLSVHADRGDIFMTKDMVEAVDTIHDNCRLYECRARHVMQHMPQIAVKKCNKLLYLSQH